MLLLSHYQSLQHRKPLAARLTLNLSKNWVGKVVPLIAGLPQASPNQSPVQHPSSNLRRWLLIEKLVAVAGSVDDLSIHVGILLKRRGSKFQHVASRCLLCGYSSRRPTGTAVKRSRPNLKRFETLSAHALETFVPRPVFCLVQSESYRRWQLINEEQKSKDGGIP